MWHMTRAAVRCFDCIVERGAVSSVKKFKITGDRPRGRSNPTAPGGGHQCFSYEIIGARTGCGRRGCGHQQQPADALPLCILGKVDPPSNQPQPAVLQVQRCQASFDDCKRTGRPKYPLRSPYLIKLQSTTAVFVEISLSTRIG